MVLLVGANERVIGVVRLVLLVAEGPNMRLRDLIVNKGTSVHAIHPEASLLEAVRSLVRHNVGSLIVLVGNPQHNAPLGIITERDIMRIIGSSSQPLADLFVADHMTRELITASPDDSIEDAMRLMTQYRVRHLPILSDGLLAGLISIGDVVKSQHELVCFENQCLKQYLVS